MLIGRETLERRERESLAPYAQRVGDSAGRRYAERAHPYRTAFQRDRARIIHSRAFRRLEYKTQVFLNGTGDHYRTRLTHTIEVASVSRTIASALGLNADLAEAISLAHDLGHAPFGHAGEEALDQLMGGHGGFEHNLQSLRVVELIESRYPEFSGLNLSYEVLEGLRKHADGYLRPAGSGSEEELFAQPSLEAQVANAADEITYSSHDLDDGLESGLLDLEQLAALALWERCAGEVRRHFPGLSGKRYAGYVIRALIDFQVEDLVRATSRRVEESGVDSADAVRRWARPLAGFGEEVKAATRELREFLFRGLYHHPVVAGPNRRGQERIGWVFRAYLASPENLGERTAARVEAEGLHRTVCDYVSGMTDRFLASEYERLVGAGEAG